jgi:DNA-binding NtrC family response regulator
MPSYHILIVDDDTITSSALKAFLEAQNYIVSMAEDCRAATEMLRGRTKIDLMILDYLMPDGNGTELLQWISEESEMQRPRVIMSSSIISSHNPGWKTLFHRLPQEAQSMVHVFVSKPYSFEHLDHAVRKTLKIGSGNTQILSGDYHIPAPEPPKKDVA